MNFSEEERLAAERLMAHSPTGVELHIRGDYFLFRDALAQELHVFRLLGRNEVKAEYLREPKK